MRQWKPVTQAYSTPLFFFCRGAARRGGRTALLFLLIRADRERVGGKDTTEVVYPDIVDMKYVWRFFGR